MLLPVLSASENSKNRCSSPQRMMRSSASRLRCTIVRRRRIEKRRRKIAIRRRVDAVGDDAVEAEIGGQLLDVDWIARAGDRAGSERQRIGLLARPGQPVVVAAQRRDMGEQEVRHQHRLRRTEVRVRRHQRVAGGSSLRRQRA